ncbi:PREDICTED: trihelix transcription factor GTL2-like [Nelumbo nucifera]|uniref:Trihelix transcription factor GTL2-like n=1 Tax=Nelumbo nucifera TaxID=4432 RepID=A0A1U7ZX90_NELNU|nr:PREDICTED: trihelix transcription factor GTL2-like [Nelumbo nucifera]
MFNGVPDQFHELISSRAALTLPLPLTLPLHVSPPPYFSGLDPSPPNHQLFQSHSLLLHQLHRHSSSVQNEEQEEEREMTSSMELPGLKSTSELVDPWREEEILALLRARSTIETGFSDFIWEHVSRKLAEVGFRRSPDKCKEKFEEMSRFCGSSNNNNSYTKNYRSFSELEAVYEGENPKTSAEKQVEITNEGGGKVTLNLEDNSGNESLVNPPVENKYVVKKSKVKKRKRHHKLELMKNFCEEIVNKIMAQQEELQNKLLQDMERREEERFAREEAWRKQEMIRINREIETRQHEQEVARDREATIIELLQNLTSIGPSQNLGFSVQNEDLLQTTNNKQNRLTSPSSSPAQKPTSLSDTFSQFNLKEPSSSANPNPPTSSSEAPSEPQNSDPTTSHQANPIVPTSSTPAMAPQNPNSRTAQNNTVLLPTSSSTAVLPPQNPNSTSSDREDHGKRWPRDEVNSLINLRCNLYNSTEDKDGNKVPIWERISQGMLELGYRRSAKKCKEKWENINKYFRKTKDANKKRSLDSKTCPYFHQLSSLYSQGTLSVPSEAPENHSSSPENRLESPETRFGSSKCGFSEAIMHVDEGKKNLGQVPALDFEY